MKTVFRTKTNNFEILMKFCMSRDPQDSAYDLNRVQMQGVFIRGDYVYATDGERLCRMLKSDVVIIEDNIYPDDGAYEILHNLRDRYFILKLDSDSGPSEHSLEAVTTIPTDWEIDFDGGLNGMVPQHSQVCTRMIHEIGKRGPILNYVKLEALPNTTKFEIHGFMDPYKPVYFRPVDVGYRAEFWIMGIRIKEYEVEVL
jgi:hypothetical protein